MNWCRISSINSIATRLSSNLVHFRWIDYITAGIFPLQIGGVPPSTVFRKAPEVYIYISLRTSPKDIHGEIHEESCHKLPLKDQIHFGS